MLEYVLWPSAFIGLFVSIFWLNVLYMQKEERKGIRFPGVSILIPAWNKEKYIEKTIRSVLDLDYPKDKLEVIVVDHGSTDRTNEIASSFRDVKVFRISRKENDVKASALNFGLNEASKEILVCLDADSYANKDSLKNLVGHFEDERLGSVISAVRIYNAETILGKLQYIEYVFTAFIRRLMSTIGTLFVTPGAMSAYRTSVLRELGGFDTNNLTEDMEIAMRLHYNHYKVKIENESIAFTDAPSTFMELWNQRVRWFRGFLRNVIKYRSMFLNKNYGMLGMFQLPLATLSVFAGILVLGLASYDLLDWLHKFLTNLYILKADYLRSITLPTLEKFALSINIKIVFPIILGILIVTYLMHRAYRLANLNWKYKLVYPIYLFYFPILGSMHWAAAIVKEIFQMKGKW